MSLSEAYRPLQNLRNYLNLNLRIGIDAGSITAAVIGDQKFRYSLWGEPIMVATQLAQTAEANTIRLTKAINDLSQDLFAFKSDDSIVLSDKRNLPTWVLSVDENNLVSNTTSKINFDKAFSNNSSIEEVIK